MAAEEEGEEVGNEFRRILKLLQDCSMVFIVGKCSVMHMGKRKRIIMLDGWHSIGIGCERD